MMPDLNLRHLRALQQIAERGSVSAAADAVGLSQPALTQGLGVLERRFGVRLFDRLPQGLRPTAAGHAVLARTDRATALFARGVRGRGGPARRGERPELRVTAAQIRALLAFAETGRLEEAGRAMGVARSTVHRGLAELERICGAPLLERRPGGLVLNENGHGMARDFALGAGELDLALQEVAREPARVSVGAMALSRSRLIPAVLAEFAAREPAVNVDVADGSYAELVGALRTGVLDIVVGTLRDLPSDDLQQEALLSDRITVIGRAGHPLAEKRSGLEALAHYPWIVGRRTSALLERWQRIFDEAGVPRPRAPIHCGSVTTIRGVLMRSDFLTLLSRDQVRAEMRAGLLTVLECDVPDTVRVLGTITRRDWFPTAAQRRFLALLHQTASRLSRSGE